MAVPVASFVVIDESVDPFALWIAMPFVPIAWLGLRRRIGYVVWFASLAGVAAILLFSAVEVASDESSTASLLVGFAPLYGLVWTSFVIAADQIVRWLAAFLRNR